MMPFVTEYVSFKLEESKMASLSFVIDTAKDHFLF